MVTPIVEVKCLYGFIEKADHRRYILRKGDIMSYKITITNNETGKILVDNDNAVAIVGAISDEEEVGQMWFSGCNRFVLARVIQEAEDIISKIKRELPEVDASLRLMETMEKMDVDKSK